MVSGFEKFDGVEAGDRNGRFISVVEVDVVRDNDNIYPQFRECPDEGNGEVQGLDHASCKLREVEVDGPDFLGGRSVRFCPGADGRIVDVEGSNPQKASLFKDAREARTAEEGDGDGGEEAFVVCARGARDLELIELAGSFASFPHGVSHGHPQVGEADGGGSGGFACEYEVEEAALAWQAGVVFRITLAPAVALLKARLEEEVLAEPWSLFDEGVFVSSLEDLTEDFVGLEEDGLWDDGVAVRARNGPGGDVLWGAARRLGLFFAPSQGIIEEDFGDVGATPSDVEDGLAAGVLHLGPDSGGCGCRLEGLDGFGDERASQEFQ